MMESLIIVIKGGLLSQVLSTNRNINVTLVDLDDYIEGGEIDISENDLKNIRNCYIGQSRTCKTKYNPEEREFYNIY